MAGVHMHTLRLWQAHVDRFLRIDVPMAHGLCRFERQCALLRVTARELGASMECGNDHIATSRLQPQAKAKATQLLGQKISGVLPTFSGDMTILRQLLSTCLDCLSEQAFDVIWIIVPAAQLLMLFDDLRPWLPRHWQFIAEEALLPSRSGDALVPVNGSWGRVGGWLKQQDLKLAAHTAVCTQFFLTLDADLVCNPRPSTCQFGSTPHMVWNQNRRHPRAVTCLEKGPGRRGGSSFWGVRSGNFANTIRVLRLPLNASTIKWVMGFTPQLMSTTAMAEVADYYETRERVNWLDYLLRAGPGRMSRCKRGRNKDGELCEKRPFYTEYFLYQLTLLVLGRWQAYHVSQPSRDLPAGCPGGGGNILMSGSDPAKAVRTHPARVPGNKKPFILVQDDLLTPPGALARWKLSMDLKGQNPQWNSRLPRYPRFTAASPLRQARLALFDELPYAADDAPRNQGGATLRLSVERRGAAAFACNCTRRMVELIVTLAMPNHSRGEGRVLLRTPRHFLDERGTGTFVHFTMEALDPWIARRARHLMLRLWLKDGGDTPSYSLPTIQIELQQQISNGSPSMPSNHTLNLDLEHPLAVTWLLGYLAVSRHAMVPLVLSIHIARETTRPGPRHSVGRRRGWQGWRGLWQKFF
mmetsp:Transcript_58675/g.134578  ORF Transcript_58675/g.134578 Transcript_58675/m.134578 type:complete len:640 (-) Transcript_58675:145-2064(-)